MPAVFGRGVDGFLDYSCLKPHRPLKNPADDTGNLVFKTQTALPTLQVCAHTQKAGRLALLRPLRSTHLPRRPPRPLRRSPRRGGPAGDADESALIPFYSNEIRFTFHALRVEIPLANLPQDMINGRTILGIWRFFVEISHR